MRTFAELLTEYIERAGISDSELARSIGVRRQTLFRWKDGQIQRPRYRDDVLRCARRLRLTPEERDLLLTAAGFSPEAPPLAVREQSPELVPEAPPEDAAAKEELQEAAPQPTVTSSRRPWVIGFAGGLVIVVGIALATAMLSNGEDPIPVAENIATPTQTPEPTVPPTVPTAVVETPVVETPEAKIAAKAVATPTPEAEDDVVVIARFVNYIGRETGYNVAGRIRAALEEEIKAEFLPSIEIKVLTEDVRDEAEAQEVAQRTNASIVIWGEYDSGRAQARFTVPALHGSMEESQVDRPVLNPADLTATINTELPHDVRLLALLIFAELYESGEDSKKARDALDEALTALPKEPDTVATIYFRLGYLYQVKEPPNLAAAEKYYTLAILYGPNSPTPYFNRGLVYWDQGEVDEAIDDFTESLFRNPRDPKVLHGRGVAYLERSWPGDAVRAIDEFSKGIEIDDTILENFFSRALAYFMLGGAHDDQALKDLHHVLTMDSDHKGSLNNLCWFMSVGGRAAEGLPYCERAINVDPDYSLAYDSRGLAYAMLGDYEKAIEDFDRFLEWLGTQPSDTYERYGPRRERWMKSLSKGENPFDEAELLALRNE
ncbi:MAG: tetratricopeptide repeat protein [Dehalococcoidia bacterium]|nr:tetratricopeptide repeat protein [Dehalococcoidia bacterium]